MSQKAPAVAKSPDLASTAKSQHVAPRSVLVPALQHGIGNRALSQLLGSGAVQAKLAVGAEDDVLEREADRVAEGVDRKPAADISRAPTSVVQRQAAPPPPEEHEPLFAVRSHREAAVTIQKKSAGGMSASGGKAQSLLTSVPPGGVPLGASVRGDMERRIGADFSAVRIHVDAISSQMNRDLNAHAFTHGSDIYFGQGKFDAASSHGRRLLAHELTHVVQQGGSRQHKLIQRDGPPAGQTKDPDVDKYTYHVLVPATAQSIEEVERFFERFVFGREMNAPWDVLVPGTTIADLRGKVIYFTIPKILVDSDVRPDKDAQEKAKKEYGKLPGKTKAEIDAEADKRYRIASGDKPGTKLKEKDQGDKKARENKLNEVLKEKETLKELPPEIKDLLGPEATYKPEDYEHLLKIVDKLKTLSKEDLAAFKLLTIRASTDLDKFEKAVDMFIARKEELKKALEAELQKKQAPTQGDKDKEPTLDDVFNEKLKDVDTASFGKLSDSEKYDLARKKTSELTAAQLKYMKDHPGETLKDFARSATLVNTPDTFKGIGKDLQEAASGDANGWARFAAGTGAGAKLSGWLLAVAGVLFVASWLTGVGELATIAAAAGYLLASTLVLSAAESELRIKAASQATTPEEFDRNIKLAAEARTTLILGVALVVIALLLHFTAKALFPETVKKISTSLKNFRERIRLKGSVDSLKPAITTEMGTLKGELAKSVAAAKQKAVAAGEALEKLSTEEFVDKLESGDSGGYLDSSKAAPGDKVNFRELLKTPEGRAAIEDYKAKLVNALKTEVPAEIDRLGQEYGSKIDDFLKEVDAAKNHDDLKAAADKVEGALTDEHLKQFLEGEQAKVTQQKLEQADSRAKADLDAANARAAADAKAKADADAKAAAAAADPKAKADADAKAEAAKKAATPPVNDAYSQFAGKNGLSDATAARLRAAKVAISRVEELIKSGESPEAAADLAIHEAELAQALEAAKLAKGNKALQLARWATQAGIVERVQRLLAFAAKSLYGNIKVLPKLIEIIAKGAQQHIQAIDDALGRMAKGHLVDIEAEADVVDRTTREAIQHKNIHKGTDAETLKDNLQSALKQLSGKGAPGEKPQPGYQRVADLRITKPENPQFNADGPALEKYLKERKALSDKVGTDPDADVNATLEGLSPDLEVRITNGKGTFVFKGPDFDLVTK